MCDADRGAKHKKLARVGKDSYTLHRAASGYARAPQRGVLLWLLMFADNT